MTSRDDRFTWPPSRIDAPPARDLGEMLRLRPRGGSGHPLEGACVAVKLLIHVTSAPCVTATEKVRGLAWRIRVMRLIRGIPVPRINHANRSDSLGPAAGDGHARRDANSRHNGISGNRLSGGIRDHLAAFP